MRPTMSSATELAFAPGVLRTVILRFLAPVRSIVLQPTPCFPMTLRFLHNSITAAFASKTLRMIASTSIRAVEIISDGAIFPEEFQSIGMYIFV